MDFAIKFSLIIYTLSFLFLTIFFIDIKITWEAKHRANRLSRITRNLTFIIAIIAICVLWSVFTYYFHNY